MYFDNLTIAGLAIAFVTALLPLFFGREMIRVCEGDASTSAPSPRQSGACEKDPNENDCATATETCG